MIAGWRLLHHTLLQEEDPFWAVAGDVLIGSVRVYLQSLCYMVRMYNVTITGTISGRVD